MTNTHKEKPRLETEEEDYRRRTRRRTRRNLAWDKEREARYEQETLELRVKDAKRTAAAEKRTAAGLQRELDFWKHNTKYEHRQKLEYAYACSLRPPAPKKRNWRLDADCFDCDGW